MGVDGKGEKESKRPFADKAQGKRGESGEIETSRGMIARIGGDVNRLYLLVSNRSNELWKSVEKSKITIPTRNFGVWGTQTLSTRHARATRPVDTRRRNAGLKSGVYKNKSENKSERKRKRKRKRKRIKMPAWEGRRYRIEKRRRPLQGSG
jgi:hypothetical protein